MGFNGFAIDILVIVHAVINFTRKITLTDRLGLCYFKSADGADVTGGVSRVQLQDFWNPVGTE